MSAHAITDLLLSGRGEAINHKIIDWFRLDAASGGHLIQPPPKPRTTSKLEQVAQYQVDNVKTLFRGREWHTGMSSVTVE